MPANSVKYQYARDTAASTLLSGIHDRERRSERDIEKIDLQRARRYGMREKQSKRRDKYTYGGIVFIYDKRSNMAITSWNTKEASNKSGTRVTTPIMLEKHSYGSKEQNKEMKRHHARLTSLLNEEDGKSQWTSHSVLVIDMSGSMRIDDLNGARCRSDGVWMTLARDYVKEQLAKGLRGPNDLISIVIMKEDAEVIIKSEPTSWTLYNKLIDLREWMTLRPSGHGNYLPAIAKAEELLASNTNASCALSLLFFSDGKPSDPPPDRPAIVSSMGKLASKFGRRLSISCIGMAQKSADFSTLRSMVDEAKRYPVKMASFGKPTLDTDSLSQIISNLASSLTTSRTEMTELRTGGLRQVRMDIEFERLHTPDSEGTWKNYSSMDESHHARRFWAWTWNDRRTGGFVEIVDRRCVHCYSEIRLHSCPDCKAAFLCDSCFKQGNAFAFHKANHGSGSECDKLLTRVAMGDLQLKDEALLPSFCIAVKDQAFGEGAERRCRKGKQLDRVVKTVFHIAIVKLTTNLQKHLSAFSRRRWGVLWARDGSKRE